MFTSPCMPLPLLHGSNELIGNEGSSLPSSSAQTGSACGDADRAAGRRWWSGIADFPAAGGKGTGSHCRCRVELSTRGAPEGSTPDLGPGASAWGLASRRLLGGRPGSRARHSNGRNGQVRWQGTSAALAAASSVLCYWSFPKDPLRSCHRVSRGPRIPLRCSVSPGWSGMPHRGYGCDWDAGEECKDKELCDLCIARLHKTSGGCREWPPAFAPITSVVLQQLLLAQQVSLWVSSKVLDYDHMQDSQLKCSNS